MKILYYHLNVVPIAIPPLLDRGDDIPILVQHFVTEFNLKHNVHIEGATDEAMAMLNGYAWPAKVRELRNVIERSVVLAKGNWLDGKTLPAYISGMLFCL